MEIVIATHNLHKIREFRAILQAFPHFDILSLLHFPDYSLPEETGTSFLENALLKAEHAAKALNCLVVADDSGLVVPKLGGAPGIYSRRYAGEEATDAENRLKLLKEMEGLEGLDRAAYFESCLALASPEKVIKSVSAICEGTISHVERGRNGFGYDPLFLKHDYDKTFAELPDETKNRVSHRRKAIDKLLITLESLKDVLI